MLYGIVYSVLFTVGLVLLFFWLEGCWQLIQDYRARWHK